MCRHVATALEQFTHASISTCLHTHEYAREDAHEDAHVQTCYTHTISSAKPHGVILVGWCGSGSHLDVDGTSV